MARSTRRNVLALGVVSLLNDTASEMIFPLLPAFLISLGASPAAFGLMEGVAEGVAALLKYASGRWSDRVRAQRPFLLAGYGLAGFVRPFLAFAGAPWQVVTVRALDRVGKGVRTSPRDALLAGSVSPEERGWAFGVHRSMDHAGAALGPLVAFAILTAWTQDLRVVFALSLLPAILAMAVLVAVVQEVPRPPEPARAAAPATPGLWRLLLPMGVFTLGNASDGFLMLAAGAAGGSLASLPLLWMALHVVRSVTSPLGGWLADRVGARPTVALGWLWYAGSYAALAVVRDPAAIAAVVLIYGVHHGLSEAAEKKLVASWVGTQAQGTAFGAYHLTLGLAAVPASLGFGLVWTWAGQAWAFGLGACLALAAVVLLAAVARPPSAASSDLAGVGAA